MRTHLVSQVVLKEFTDDAGFIMVNYTDSTRESELKKTRDVAFVHMDEVYIDRLEQEWNQTIESDTKKTLRILRNGDVLNHRKHISVLKKLMALHFIRSYVLMDVFSKISELHINEAIEDVMVIISKDREYVRQLFEPRLPNMLGRVLANSLDDLLKKTDVYLNDFGIEVGIAPKGSQFILSDCPAMTMDKKGNIGINQGVAILQATEFAMVMTPKHIVALKSGEQGVKYVRLTAEHVENVNRKQVKHSFKEYYTVPNDSNNLS